MSQKRGPRRENAAFSFYGYHHLRRQPFRLLGDTESWEMASDNNPEQKFSLVDREHYVTRPFSLRAGGLPCEVLSRKSGRSA